MKFLLVSVSRLSALSTAALTLSTTVALSIALPKTANGNDEGLRFGIEAGPQIALLELDNNNIVADTSKGTVTDNIKGNVRAESGTQAWDNAAFAFHSPAALDAQSGRNTERAINNRQASGNPAHNSALTEQQQGSLLKTPRSIQPSELEEGQPLLVAAKKNKSRNNPEALIAETHWYGKMRCKNQYGKQFDAEVELNMQKIEKGTYSLAMVVSHQNSMNAGTIETAYAGEDSPDGDGSRQFVVTKKVRGGGIGGSSNPGSFRLVEHPETNELTVTFSSGGCENFTARSFDALPFRTLPTTKNPKSGGSYWAETDDRGKCEIVIQWTDRLTKEYPETVFLYNNDQEVKWKKILLFADDDFVPVFGEPYDVMPYERRTKAHRQIVEICSRKNPFTRERMVNFFAAADRVLPENPRQQLTSDGYSSVVFAIRKIREERNKILALRNIIETKPDDESDFATLVSNFISFKSAAETASVPLWPSETKNGVDQAYGYLSSKAEVEAENTLQKITGSKSTVEGLSLVRKALAGDRGGFLAFLAEDNKEQVKGKLNEHYKQFVSVLMEPLITKVDLAETSLEGVRFIEQVIVSDIPKVAELSTPDRQEWAQIFKKKQDERLKQILAVRIAEFNAYPSGVIGLQNGQVWWTKISNEFDWLGDNGTLNKAKDEFLSDRTRRLREALPEFQAKVESSESNNLNGATIMEQYLSLPSDLQQPISLEYMFILAENEK